jgi:hypothetical protein
MKFKEVVGSYVSYVKNNYGVCHVVFDGYTDSSSIKYTEHERRKKANGSCQDININVENEAPCQKERFLSNKSNKVELISLLSKAFKDHGHEVYVCKGDADTKIVSTALEVAKLFKTTVVADDTDVALMLLYHWHPGIHEVYFFQERGKKKFGT